MNSIWTYDIVNTYLCQRLWGNLQSQDQVLEKTNFQILPKHFWYRGHYKNYQTFWSVIIRMANMRVNRCKMSTTANKVMISECNRSLSKQSGDQVLPGTGRGSWSREGDSTRWGQLWTGSSFPGSGAPGLWERLYFILYHFIYILYVYIYYKYILSGVVS